MRPSGLHVNKPALFGILAVTLTLALVYKFLWSSTSVASFSAFNFGFMGSGKTEVTQSSTNKSRVAVAGANSKIIEVGQLKSPPELSDALLAVMKKDQHKSDEVEVEVGGKKIKIYVEQVIPVGPPKLDILLLHGMAFTSANWVEIKTVYQLANWGYRAIAIDLPGKGKSKDSINLQKTDEFLTKFISTLGMKNVVIVSPSASGRYSLPYLFNEPAKSTEKALGFVPVAPVDTNEFVSKFKDSKLPTLILYGSKDPAGPRTMNDLVNLANHRIARLEGAGHPCYIDKTDDFHKVLYEWLKNLIK